MSNALRSAVAAATLFTCPACVTTGSITNSLEEPSPTATTTTRAEAVGAVGAVVAPPPASTSAPSASALRSVGAAQLPQSTPRTSVPVNSTNSTPPARGPVPVNSAVNSTEATAATLAWEQSHSGLTSMSSGNPNLLFEPTDSRMRIVLNVLDLAKFADRVPLNASANANAGEESAALARIGNDAALWFAPPTETPPEPIDMDPSEEPVGVPVESPASLIDAPPTEPHATPEPTTLALAALGLGAWRMIRRVRRVKHW